MTSFLTKTKSYESYEQRISTEPASTQRSKKYAISNFEKFVSETYDGRTVDEIIDELDLVKTKNEQGLEDSLYDMLQAWINWNELRDISPSTIKVAFSNLRKYLFFRKIKTNEQDIREYLRFPKTPKEEKHPLSDSEYHAIVDGLAKNPMYQSVCLALGSSGMRIGELMNVRKKDLDLSTKRITVKIPPNTKTRTGRTTFFTKEVEEKIKKRLGELNPDDYVFCKKSPYSGGFNFRLALRRILKRLGLDEKYQSNNYCKISPHSFRAYFFTKAARKHDDNYAHRMIGHGGYLMQYDRMTEEEKMDMYIELEPDLVVYDQTKNKLKIEQLEEENASISQIREEVGRLREQLAKQDKKILAKLREDKTIPS